MTLKKLSAFLLFFPLSVFAKSVEFSVPSFDGKAHITGQLDLPETTQAKMPTVIIVGGTGLFSRTGYFGRSGTPQDEIFTTLAKSLNQQGFAVARFDYRGVSCDIRAKTDAEKCIDQKLRATVTPQTILDDIQAIYDWTLKQATTDASKVFFIGHSEGSLNISRLVARKSVQPQGILFIGGIVESTTSILHWQIVLRPTEWLLELDTNKDALLTNDEIKAGYETSKIKKSLSIPLEDLLSPTGSWTEQSILEVLEQPYRQMAKEVATHADIEPYVHSGVVFTSYSWWKQWFLPNQVSVLENLKDFSGPISYHNGDIDSQTPGLREQKLLSENRVPLKSQPTFHLYPGKGHGLGSDLLYGPMDEAIRNALVTELKSWVN